MSSSTDSTSMDLSEWESVTMDKVYTKCKLLIVTVERLITVLKL